MYAVKPRLALALAAQMRRLAYLVAVLGVIVVGGAAIFFAVPLGRLLSTQHPGVAALGVAVALAVPAVAVVSAMTLPLFAAPFFLEHIADAALARELDLTRNRPITPAPGLPRVVRPEVVSYPTDEPPPPPGTAPTYG